MVAWICVKADGNDFFDAPSKVTGSAKAWLWLASLTSVTGSFSTITVNISDFSRFSKKPGSQIWQLPVIPLFKVWIGAFGIISASASAKIWGQPLWVSVQRLGRVDSSLTEHRILSSSSTIGMGPPVVVPRRSLHQPAGVSLRSASTFRQTRSALPTM
jgi:cytosine/uracil/thiamine/allantoin permease